MSDRPKMRPIELPDKYILTGKMLNDLTKDIGCISPGTELENYVADKVYFMDKNGIREWSDK